MGRTAYDSKVLGYNPIAHYPLNEGSGSVLTELLNAWNGTYTGIQWGLDKFKDASAVPYFDGANDHGAIYTTGLRDAFNGAEGTIAIWAKVPAAAWTDSTVRVLFQLQADAQNYVALYKPSVSGRIAAYYEAGNVAENIQYTLPAAPTIWFHWAMTWSKSAGASGEVKHYYKGAQVGSTYTGLGTWAGNLGATGTCIGAGSTTPTQVWNGYVRAASVWASALDASQIEDLSKFVAGKKMYGVLGSPIIQGV